MKFSKFAGALVLGTSLAFAQLSVQEKPKKLEEIVFVRGNPEKNFEKFLDEWQAEYQPKDVSGEDNTIKNVYQLYQQLFMPLDLSGETPFSSNKKVNKNIKNVVVPGSFVFYINDYAGENGARQVIQDKRIIKEFRPKLNFEKDVRILYLTEKYDSLLNQFLGDESTEFGTPNIMNPSRAKGKSANREEFVKKFFPIVQGHWGNYWHLETMPTMVFVFNKTLDKVEVTFRAGYGGRIIDYQKKDGKWQEIETEYRKEWVE